MEDFKNQDFFKAPDCKEVFEFWMMADLLFDRLEFLLEIRADKTF